MRLQTLPECITWRIEGPFDSSYSLALLNREVALALEGLGHEVVLHSTEGPGDFAPNETFLLAHPKLARLHRKAALIPPEAADVTSRNLYPPRVEDMTCRLNLLHNFGWEESGFPQEWVSHFNEHLQGITCVSRYVQKIMVDHGVTVPLVTVGNGVGHCARVEADPTFRVEAHDFRFLHVSSCFPRKGADVLLKAYGQAFSAADPVTLVIKTFPNPHNEIREWLASAQKTTPHYPDVLLIEEDLSDAQLKALYQQCHALVMPSRAEGFGLPMAEAMMYGLPVITTGWSGQVDFCTPETAWLVDFTFAPAETHFGLFNSVWAEPDSDHLAQLMRDVYALPAEARRHKSDAGRKLLMQNFKWEDVAGRLVTAAQHFAIAPAQTIGRVGWVTTWNEKCAIAAYSAHLVDNLPDDVTILASHTAVQTTPDGLEVVRCWKAGKDDALQALLLTIEERGIDTLIIQFSYRFFNFTYFSDFLVALANAGKSIVVMMHETADVSDEGAEPVAQLAVALSGCQRVLVHSPHDLNRLKAIGLIDNVTLFPHGVQDRPTRARAVSSTPFTIASYGFFLPHKGLLELIEALSLLVKEGRSVCLKLINAAYPIPASSALIEVARNRAAQLGLTDAIEIVEDFLSDDESLNRLSSADLIVFPYQHAIESSSAAVRYGLASGRPVAVTPLRIFDDVSRVVFTLPGKSPAKIAQGIRLLMDNILGNDPEVSQKLSVAERWREEHRHFRIGSRLHGILSGLAQTRTLGKVAESRDDSFRSTLFQRLSALQQRALAAELRALTVESEAKEEAKKYAIRVQMAESRAGEQERRALTAESRAGEQERRALIAESRAGEQERRALIAESRTEALLKSWSWRSTTPMRWVASAMYSFFYRSVIALQRLLPRIFARLACEFLRFFPALGYQISQWLFRYPVFRQKLLNAVLQHTTLPSTDPHRTLIEIVPLISHDLLDPRAQKIYAELKDTIETAQFTQNIESETSRVDALTPNSSLQKREKN